MDKTSKKIIKFMKKNPDNFIFYSSEPYKKLDISSREFFRAVQYLESLELVQYVTNQDGRHLGITLTHKTIHSKAIKFDSFKNWLFSTFMGGVIIGVCSTILSEFVLLLGAFLLGLL